MSPTDADATTDRIRAEAVRLFAQRGYGNTTIEHISTAADVGVATIYRRWPDKAAIANELYREGIDAMSSILADRHTDEPRSEFVTIWRDLWQWASTRRDLALFVYSSAGAPWLSDENVARKVELGGQEIQTYARLRFDVAPDFAAALIGGALTSIVEKEPDIDPDEVAERLWRALSAEG